MGRSREYPAPDYAAPPRRARMDDHEDEDDFRGELVDRGYARRSFADDLLDSVLPAKLDWQRLVRDYPIPALAVAALGGYWLGRKRGPSIVGALTALAATTVTRAANDILGEDLIEED